MAGEDEFYLRYYVGHKGRFGHEFLEFEFYPNGKMRYANNSHYKNETMIRKEGVLEIERVDKMSLNIFFLLFIAAFVQPSVLKELKRIIEESEITK